ncbi:MAG: M48 family metalloprotease [Candidatus Omnitrophica bacterium]|nr:M48 family metalloprotease [Candidatus Omnitrophota bacterium]
MRRARRTWHNERRHTVLRHGAVILSFFLGGCVRSNFNLATKEEEYTITSTEKEVELGRKLARHVEQELPVAADESLQQKVRSIGERIVAACDRQELVYSFVVVQDKEVNAFSLPGGYVYVDDGLIKKTSSDDELAGVIAHEVAHIAARHAVKRYESSLGLQIAQLATLAARQGDALRGVGIALRAAQLSYARQDELEADRLGVKYMKAAGFNPLAILTFLQKLQELDREKIHYLPRGVVRPQYALTHPYVPDRLRAIKEELFGVADYIDYLNAPP